VGFDQGLFFTYTHILDMTYLMLPELPPAVIKSLGLLSWTTEERY
jgi:hypothetical protein